MRAPITEVATKVEKTAGANRKFDLTLAPIVGDEGKTELRSEVWF